MYCIQCVEEGREMSRIESIRTNSQQNINTKTRNIASQPYFTAKPTPPSPLTKVEENIILDTLINKYLGRGGKFLDMLSRTAGEMQNIVIIGLGTAFIAPIFIANNPLSKEDKKSKQYSALRQPISAVIATATSLGINYPIAKWFNEKATNGSLAKFDMSAAPPKEYLKDLYSKVNGRLKKGKGIGKLSRTEKTIIDLIPSDSITNHQIWREKYPSFQDFVSVVHEATKNKYAEKMLSYDNKEGLRQMSVKDFLIKNLEFLPDDINKEILNPDDVKIKLTDVKAMTFLKALGIDDIDESTLRKYLGDNFYEGKFNELKNNDAFSQKLYEIFSSLPEKNVEQKELVELFANDEMLSDKLGADLIEDLYNSFKTSQASNATPNNFQNEINKYFNKDFTSAQCKKITRIAELLIPEEMKNAETITLKNLFKVVKFDKIALDEGFYNNTNVLNMKMDKFLLALDKAMHLDELRAHKLKVSTIKVLSSSEKLIKFAKAIGANAAKKGENALKSYSKAQGIILSLLVLPPSCTFLNWAYPRVMDALFPSLSKSKAQNKGGK